MSTTTGPTTDPASTASTSTVPSQATQTTPTTPLGTERPSRFRQLTAPKKRVIRNWDPEDTEAWEAGNKDVARRNLIWSVATEHVGFSIWSIWSVMVLFMPQAVYGFTPADKFFLVAVPTLVGAVLRITQQELAYLVGSLGRDGYAVIDNGSRSIEFVGKDGGPLRYRVPTPTARLAH